MFTPGSDTKRCFLKTPKGSQRQSEASWHLQLFASDDGLQPVAPMSQPLLIQAEGRVGNIFMSNGKAGEVTAFRIGTWWMSWQRFTIRFDSSYSKGKVAASLLWLQQLPFDVTGLF